MLPTRDKDADRLRRPAPLFFPIQARNGHQPVRSFAPGSAIKLRTVTRLASHGFFPPQNMSGKGLQWPLGVCLVTAKMTKRTHKTLIF